MVVSQGMDRESLHRLAALASSCLGLVEAELKGAQDHQSGSRRLRMARQRVERLKRVAELLEQLARAATR